MKTLLIAMPCLIVLVLLENRLQDVRERSAAMAERLRIQQGHCHEEPRTCLVASNWRG